MTTAPRDPIAAPVGRSPRQWQAHLQAQAQRGHAVRQFLPEIMADGYAQAEAETWIAAALRSQRNKAIIILVCSAILLCGGVSTFAAAMQAQPGTTSYLWIGAVVSGAIGIVYGLGRLARVR